MDVRKLGRWLGRVTAVATFGAGATLGSAVMAAANAGVDGSDSSNTGTEVSSTADGAPGADASTAATSWEGASLLDTSWE